MDALDCGKRRKKPRERARQEPSHAKRQKSSQEGATRLPPRFDAAGTSFPGAVMGGQLAAGPALGTAWQQMHPQSDVSTGLSSTNGWDSNGGTTANMHNNENLSSVESLTAQQNNPAFQQVLLKAFAVAAVHQASQVPKSRNTTRRSDTTSHVPLTVNPVPSEDEERRRQEEAILSLRAVLMGQCQAMVSSSGGSGNDSKFRVSSSRVAPADLECPRKSPPHPGTADCSLSSKVPPCLVPLLEFLEDKNNTEFSSFPQKLMLILNYFDRCNQVNDCCRRPSSDNGSCPWCWGCYCGGNAPILEWAPNGKAFTIHSTKRFCKIILPYFFSGSGGAPSKQGKKEGRTNRIESFTRKCYRWGFRHTYIPSKMEQNQRPKRVSSRSSSDDELTLGHDFLQRDNPELLHKMKSATAVAKHREMATERSQEGEQSRSKRQKVGQEGAIRVPPAFAAAGTDCPGTGTMMGYQFSSGSPLGTTRENMNQNGVSTAIPPTNGFSTNTGMTANAQNDEHLFSAVLALLLALEATPAQTQLPHPLSHQGAPAATINLSSKMSVDLSALTCLVGSLTSGQNDPSFQQELCSALALVAAQEPAQQAIPSVGNRSSENYTSPPQLLHQAAMPFFSANLPNPALVKKKVSHTPSTFLPHSIDADKLTFLIVSLSQQLAQQHQAAPSSSDDSTQKAAVVSTRSESVSGSTSSMTGSLDTNGMMPLLSSNPPSISPTSMVGASNRKRKKAPPSRPTPAAAPDSAAGQQEPPTMTPTAIREQELVENLLRLLHHTVGNAAAFE